jgi:hypothetical protein
MAGEPDLRRGDTGDWVRHLQGQLGTLYSGAVDGIFGPLTDAAVRQYQTDHGLTVDGWVGPLTWGALNSNPVGGSAPAGTTPGAGTPVGPINLQVPFTLQLQYFNMNFSQLNAQLSSFQLPTSPPTARLTFPSSVSKLIGNGGIQLINTSIPLLGPSIAHLTATATGHWAASQGLVLDAKFNGDINLFDFRGITMSVTGGVNFHWAPGPAQGSVDWNGGLQLKVDLDILSGMRRR